MKKNRKMKRIMAGILTPVLAFAMFFGAFRANAENISGSDYEELAVDPTSDGIGYSAVLYDNNNGLPTSEANTICETEEGFIWIGGYSGLIRYDGNNFERIESTETGITSVVSLYVDSRNRLWIGTNDNGVIVMEKGEFTQYNRVGGLTSSSVRSITEDPDGYIFVATTHGIGVIDPEGTLTLLNETQINDEYIRELRTDATGVIYGETQNGAAFTIENRRLTGFYDGTRLGISDIKSILPDSANPGYVYLGTSHSEIYYGKLSDGMKKAEKINCVPLNEINSMEIVEGNLWICSDNGVGMVENKKFTKLNNLPMNNSIDQMLVDYEGNLWFTSSRQGVMKIVPNRFTDIFYQYNMDSTVVNSTCKLGGILYMGTDTGLMAVDKSGKLSNINITSLEGAPEAYDGCTNFVELMADTRIRSIIKDSKDRLWFSTYTDKGLVRYDHGKVKCFTADDGLPSNRVRVVYERSDGNIMAACTGGMAVLDNNKVIDVYDTRTGLSNPEILTLCEAFDGSMLLGSDGDGIYVLNNTGVKNVGYEEGLTSEVVLRIKRDDERHIYWVVTSNSIGYMDEEYQMTTIKQFPYTNNFDLVENSRGEVWVLSSNGVYVCEVEELLANENLDPMHYSKDNGLPCVSTANSYSCVDENGDLYIAGTTGVAKVNIEVPFYEVAKIKMAVPYIDADGEIIYPDEEGVFHVKAGVKRVRIYDFVYTYSLLNPDVTYYLKGFEKTKTTVRRNDMEPVDYTNLRGGTYEFIMTLHDNAGSGQNELKVTIVKDKSIYEKVWFWLFVGLTATAFIIGIALIISRRRMEKLLAKQEENRLFIREMIEAFAKVIDMKDKYTNGHSTRVAEYTEMLSKELGYDEETVEKFRNIALLHDIGKIGIRPEVLNKNGRLTDDEFAEIKSHSSLGYKTLKDISIMPELATGAEAHHERPDGKGYPRGLKGDEIPRVAQIIAVADTFDAMYSDRPYRKRMNFEKAVSIIKEVSGTQLTPDVVDAFLRLVEQGKFRDPDDVGGGSVEDISNIHEAQKKEALEETKTKYEEVKEELIEELKEEAKEKAIEKAIEEAKEKAAEEAKDGKVVFEEVTEEPK